MQLDDVSLLRMELVGSFQSLSGRICVARIEKQNFVKLFDSGFAWIFSYSSVNDSGYSISQFSRLSTSSSLFLGGSKTLLLIVDRFYL